MAVQRTFMGYFVSRKWSNMNIRCGKYKHLQTKDKCATYSNISIEFTRAEFKDWCYKNEGLIRSLKRPSIDRIDSSKNYSFDNMRIIELEENIKHKEDKHGYSKGKKFCGKKRGAYETKNGKWYALIRISGKKTYLGTFETEKEAYEAYRKAYLIQYGEYPF